MTPHDGVSDIEGQQSPELVVSGPDSNWRVAPSVHIVWSESILSILLTLLAVSQSVMQAANLYKGTFLPALLPPPSFSDNEKVPALQLLDC